MNTHDLFHAGKLREAVAAAIVGVREHPTDTGRRLLLSELFCFTGELERADNQLDALGHDDPKILAGIKAFRQLIRAETARQDFFTSGRLPTFLGKPEGSIPTVLEASIRLREGATAEASALLEQAEESRVKVSGTCDDRTFEDFRDLDDLIGGVFEVLTVNGEYYWVPIDRVESVEFPEPTRPRDLIWRRTLMTVRGGPDGEVYVPVLYPGTSREDDDQLRLGRLTDWRGGDSSPVRGLGQRTFLIGEEAVPILEIKSITFTTPESSETAPVEE